MYLNNFTAKQIKSASMHILQIKIFYCSTRGINKNKRVFFATNFKPFSKPFFQINK